MLRIRDIKDEGWLILNVAQRTERDNKRHRKEVICGNSIGRDDYKNERWTGRDNWYHKRSNEMCTIFCSQMIAVVV